MRALLRITLSFALLAWCAMAQRGGGHGSGGGGSHASMGGGVGHGSVGGGYHGGGATGSAYRGGYSGSRGYGSGAYGYGRGYGYGGYGYRGYGYRGYGYRGGYWPFYGWGYPWFGFGYSYWPGYYYGYGDYYPYNYYYPDTYSDPSYAYSPDPMATYAPAQGDPYGQTARPGTYSAAAHPVTHAYDEYGQETAATGGSPTNSSPIYLLAQKDGEIQAAASYWIAGQTLHYVTLDRQEKQVALSSIDRALTQQLNRERRVSITLPAQ
ncbi:MAG: hypothetical protein WBL61_09340 [Bryobacteraceae bacterium]